MTVSEPTGTGRQLAQRPYGRTGVVRAADAGRALPYEMRPLHTREWRA